MKHSAEKLSRRKQKKRCGVVQVRVESSGEKRWNKGENLDRVADGGARGWAQREEEREGARGDLWQALSSNEIARCSFLQGGARGWWEPSGTRWGFEAAGGYWWRSPRRGAGWFSVVCTNSHVAQLPLASCVSAASFKGLLIARTSTTPLNSSVLSFITRMRNTRQVFVCANSVHTSSMYILYT